MSRATAFIKYNFNMIIDKNLVLFFFLNETIATGQKVSEFLLIFKF